MTLRPEWSQNSVLKFMTDGHLRYAATPCYSSITLYTSHKIKPEMTLSAPKKTDHQNETEHEISSVSWGAAVVQRLVLSSSHY
jgi:hypothetical protein